MQEANVYQAITCPGCNNEIVPIVDYEYGLAPKIMACLLCPLCSCCLPFLIPEFKTPHYYCPNCNSQITEYDQKFGRKQSSDKSKSPKTITFEILNINVLQKMPERERTQEDLNSRLKKASSEECIEYRPKSIKCVRTERNFSDTCLKFENAHKNNLDPALLPQSLYTKQFEKSALPCRRCMNPFYESITCCKCKTRPKQYGDLCKNNELEMNTCSCAKLEENQTCHKCRNTSLETNINVAPKTLAKFEFITKPKRTSRSRSKTRIKPKPKSTVELNVTSCPEQGLDTKKDEHFEISAKSETSVSTSLPSVSTESSHRRKTSSHQKNKAVVEKCKTWTKTPSRYTTTTKKTIYNNKYVLNKKLQKKSSSKLSAVPSKNAEIICLCKDKETSYHVSPKKNTTVHVVTSNSYVKTVDDNTKANVANTTSLRSKIPVDISRRNQMEVINGLLKLLEKQQSTSAKTKPEPSVTNVNVTPMISINSLDLSKTTPPSRCNKCKLRRDSSESSLNALEIQQKHSTAEKVKNNKLNALNSLERYTKHFPTEKQKNKSTTLNSESSSIHETKTGHNRWAIKTHCHCKTSKTTQERVICAHKPKRSTTFEKKFLHGSHKPKKSKATASKESLLKIHDCDSKNKEVKTIYSRTSVSSLEKNLRNMKEIRPHNCDKKKYAFFHKSSKPKREKSKSKLKCACNPKLNTTQMPVVCSLEKNYVSRKEHQIKHSDESIPSYYHAKMENSDVHIENSEDRIVHEEDSEKSRKSAHLIKLKKSTSSAKLEMCASSTQSLEKMSRKQNKKDAKAHKKSTSKKGESASVICISSSMSEQFINKAHKSKDKNKEKYYCTCGKQERTSRVSIQVSHSTEGMLDGTEHAKVKANRTETQAEDTHYKRSKKETVAVQIEEKPSEVSMTDEKLSDLKQCKCKKVKESKHVEHVCVGTKRKKPNTHSETVITEECKFRNSKKKSKTQVIASSSETTLVLLDDYGPKHKRKHEKHYLLQHKTSQLSICSVDSDRALKKSKSKHVKKKKDKATPALYDCPSKTTLTKKHHAKVATCKTDTKLKHGKEKHYLLQYKTSQISICSIDSDRALKKSKSKHLKKKKEKATPTLCDCLSETILVKKCHAKVATSKNNTELKHAKEKHHLLQKKTSQLSICSEDSDRALKKSKSKRLKKKKEKAPTTLCDCPSETTVGKKHHAKVATSETDTKLKHTKEPVHTTSITIVNEITGPSTTSLYSVSSVTTCVHPEKQSRPKRKTLFGRRSKKKLKDVCVYQEGPNCKTVKKCSPVSDLRATMSGNLQTVCGCKKQHKSGIPVSVSARTSPLCCCGAHIHATEMISKIPRCQLCPPCEHHASHPPNKLVSHANHHEKAHSDKKTKHGIFSKNMKHSPISVSPKVSHTSICVRHTPRRDMCGICHEEVVQCCSCKTSRSGSREKSDHSYHSGCGTCRKGRHQKITQCGCPKKNLKCGTDGHHCPNRSHSHHKHKHKQKSKRHSHKSRCDADCRRGRASCPTLSETCHMYGKVYPPVKKKNVHEMSPQRNAKTNTPQMYFFQENTENIPRNARRRSTYNTTTQKNAMINASSEMHFSQEDTENYRNPFYSHEPPPVLSSSTSQQSPPSDYTIYPNERFFICNHVRHSTTPFHDTKRTEMMPHQRRRKRSHSPNQKELFVESNSPAVRKSHRSHRHVSPVNSKPKQLQVSKAQAFFATPTPCAARKHRNSRKYSPAHSEPTPTYRTYSPVSDSEIPISETSSDASCISPARNVTWEKPMKSNIPILVCRKTSPIFDYRDKRRPIYNQNYNNSSSSFTSYEITPRKKNNFAFNHRKRCIQNEPSNTLNTIQTTSSFTSYDLRPSNKNYFASDRHERKNHHNEQTRALNSVQIIDTNVPNREAYHKTHQNSYISPKDSVELIRATNTARCEVCGQKPMYCRCYKKKEKVAETKNKCISTCRDYEPSAHRTRNRESRTKDHSRIVRQKSLASIWSQTSNSELKNRRFNEQESICHRSFTPTRRNVHNRGVNKCTNTSCPALKNQELICDRTSHRKNTRLPCPSKTSKESICSGSSNSEISRCQKCRKTVSRCCCRSKKSRPKKITRVPCPSQTSKESICEPSGLEVPSCPNCHKPVSSCCCRSKKSKNIVRRHRNRSRHRNKWRKSRSSRSCKSTALICSPSKEHNTKKTKQLCKPPRISSRKASKVSFSSSVSSYSDRATEKSSEQTVCVATKSQKKQTMSACTTESIDSLTEKSTSAASSSNVYKNCSTTSLVVAECQTLEQYVCYPPKYDTKKRRAKVKAKETRAVKTQPLCLEKSVCAEMPLCVSNNETRSSTVSLCNVRSMPTTAKKPFLGRFGQNKKPKVKKCLICQFDEGKSKKDRRKRSPINSDFTVSCSGSENVCEQQNACCQAHYNLLKSMPVCQRTSLLCCNPKKNVTERKILKYCYVDPCASANFCQRDKKKNRPKQMPFCYVVDTCELPCQQPKKNRFFRGRKEKAEQKVPLCCYTDICESAYPCKEHRKNDCIQIRSACCSRHSHLDVCCINSVSCTRCNRAHRSKTCFCRKKKRCSCPSKRKSKCSNERVICGKCSHSRYKHKKKKCSRRPCKC